MIQYSGTPASGPGGKLLRWTSRGLRGFGPGEDLPEAAGAVRQRIGEQPFDVEPEAGEDVRAEDAAILQRDTVIASLVEAVELAPPLVGIDDPVFADAGALVDALLLVVIAEPALFGDDLDGDVRRA